MLLLLLFLSNYDSYFYNNHNSTIHDIANPKVCMAPRLAEHFWFGQWNNRVSGTVTLIQNLIRLFWCFCFSGWSFTIGKHLRFQVHLFLFFHQTDIFLINLWYCHQKYVSISKPCSCPFCVWKLQTLILVLSVCEDLMVYKLHRQFVRLTFRLNQNLLFS